MHCIILYYYLTASLASQFPRSLCSQCLRPVVKGRVTRRSPHMPVRSISLSPFLCCSSVLHNSQSRTPIVPSSLGQIISRWCFDRTVGTSFLSVLSVSVTVSSFTLCPFLGSLPFTFLLFLLSTLVPVWFWLICMGGEMCLCLLQDRSRDACFNFSLNPDEVQNHFMVRSFSIFWPHIWKRYSGHSFISAGSSHRCRRMLYLMRLLLNNVYFTFFKVALKLVL